MADDVTRQQLDLDVQKFLASLSQAETALRKFSDSSADASKRMSDGFKPLDSLFGTLQSKLSALASQLAAVVSVAGIVEITRSAGAAAESLTQLSETIGVSQADLQGYEVLLNRTGQSTDALGHMFRTLSQALVEAHDPASDAARYFAQLGISQQDIRKGDVNQIIRQIADGMANMSSASDRAAISSTLLGRSGLQLIPAFSGGKKAIDEAAKSSKDMGEMSAVQSKRLGEMDDKIDDLSLSWKRFGQQVGDIFGPIVKMGTSLLTSLVNMASSVVREINTSIQTLWIRFTYIGKAMAVLAGQVFSTQVFNGSEWDKAFEKIKQLDAEAADLIQKTRDGMVSKPDDTGKSSPQGSHLSDRGDLKRDLDHKVAMAEQGYRAEEMYTHSEQALKEKYYAWINAQRTRDLGLEGVTQQKRLEINGKYDQQIQAFDLQRTRKTNEENLAALTAYGKDRQAKEEEQLTMAARSASQDVELFKSQNKARLDIYLATLASIEAEEKAAKEKANGNILLIEDAGNQSLVRRAAATKAYHDGILADEKSLKEEAYKMSVTMGEGFEEQRAKYFALLKLQRDEELLATTLTEEGKQAIRQKYLRLWREFNLAEDKKQAELFIEGANKTTADGLEKARSALQQLVTLRQAEVQAGINEMASLEELSKRRIRLIEAERDAKLAALPTEGDQSLARQSIEREASSRLNREILEGQGDLLAGLRRGWYTYTTDLGNVFNYAVDFARSTAQAMQDGFRTFFFDAFTGKIASLKDLFTGFKDFTLKLLSDIAARLAASAAINFITSMFGAAASSSSLSTGAYGPGSLGFGGLTGVATGHDGGWGIPKYRFGGPTFLDDDRYPALLRRGEFVLNPTGVDTLSKINQGQTPTQPSGNVSVNIVNSGRQDKPQVNIRQQMREMVIDVIFKDIAANGQLRGLMG